MKPIIKWTGGKRREIERFQHYIPEHKLYIEPFFGGGAVFWHLEPEKSIINDFDNELINFYRNINNIKEDLKLLSKIDDRDTLEQKYYEFRDIDIKKLSDKERAIRFAFVNQLAFSGMRRFNKDGKFNVPFGYYKKFSINITNKHIELLNNATIYNRDALEIIKENDKEDTFIFLDPPYTRVFKTYSPDNNFDDKKQEELAEILYNLKNAQFLLIIDKSDLTLRLYNDLIKNEYSLSYGVNIKNRFNTEASHLIISNYEPIIY